MVINYSKWDALELSDDSDIEVHPNVDKRSFIRAKQNQIHMERDKRRHEIKTLKYERTVNDGLLDRIDNLLANLRAHANQVTGANPGHFMMGALMSAGKDVEKDKVPPPPEDIRYNEKQPTTYSEMLASLVDQVKKEATIRDDDWYKAYMDGILEHLAKVQDLQKQLLERMKQLEKEESSKITSDSIHDGFNTSSVVKAKPGEKSKPKAETVEVLNPGSLEKGKESGMERSSGADADIEPSSNTEAEDDVELTPLAREFGKIRQGDYNSCLRFIADHREVLAEKNQDGLLMEAFNAQLEDKPNYAKQCVHQALLLQYCRSLGKDGVGLFFKR